MKTSAKIKQSVLILLILGLLPVISSAQEVTQRRETPSFTGVEASGIFNVFLYQGEEFSVIVEAEERLHPNIETQVRNGILNISHSGSTRRGDQMTIYITAPSFTSLKASGATSFRSETMLNSPELEVSATGASSFFLDIETGYLNTRIGGASSATYTGYATSHELSVTGASVLRAFDLTTQHTEAKVGGASTARVYAQEFLKADVSGTSSLTYKERPQQQDLRTTGMSSIRGANNAAATAENDQDTVKVIVGEREVRVVDRNGPRHWSIHRKPSHTFKGNWGGFELGINGYFTPDRTLEMEPGYEFLDLRYEKAIAVNINMFQQSFNLIGNQLGLVTGLGLGWNNYRFADNIIPVMTPEGIDVAEPNPEYNYRKSKMTLLYLNVPLMMEFQTRGRNNSQGFHIAAGVNTGLRLRSHTKQVYHSNGVRNKDKTYDDFHLRPFRFEATGRIGWGRISLFANYSLNSLFRDDRGPELYPFSVGLRIIRW